MKTIYSDRRLDQKQFRHLDHALNLARTYGWHYAVAYLRNQKIEEATIQRVLLGDYERRRASSNNFFVCQPMPQG